MNKKIKLPKSGVIIYTSRSGQQYPSYFDEENDLDFSETVYYIFDILDNYIDLDEWDETYPEHKGRSKWDHKYFTDLKSFLEDNDQGTLTIIQNQPSYEKYQEWL